MNTWLKMDGTRVLGVLKTDQESLGAPWVLSVGGWDDSIKPPHAYMLPHVVDGVRVWLDSRSLAQAKEKRVALMREARELAINSTFVWDGSTFDADQVSQTRLLGLLTKSIRPGFTNQGWRLANNTWRVLDAEDVDAVWGALENHLESNFATFAAREATINSALDVAAVDAVNWLV